MIIPYKDRVIEDDHIVKVYRNLHNGMFSIKCAKTGLVLAHGNGFTLQANKFHVNEKGRQKVILEKSKSVHAYVIGVIEQSDAQEPINPIDELYYNPYTQDSFTLKYSGIIPIDGLFLFESGKAYILNRGEDLIE